MSARVVIFGGTFDPVQCGHMAVADQAHRLLRANKLWFVVANLPPLRRPAVAPAAARVEMLHAAVAGDQRFTVIDLEIRRGGATYTADTMAELHREHPDTDFRVLLGADVARSVPAWHRAAELLAREQFVIVNRAGETPLGLDEAVRLGFDPQHTELLEVASPPVSATEVRRRVAGGESLAGLVPDAVAAIIARDGLYRTGRAVHNAGG